MQLTKLSLLALCAVTSASSNQATLKSSVHQRLRARNNSTVAAEGIFDKENFGLDFDDDWGGFFGSLGTSISEVASVPVKATSYGYDWLNGASPIPCSKAGQVCDSMLYQNAVWDCEGHYAKCWKGCCCEDKKAACAIIGHIPDVIPAVAAIVGYCAATGGGCAFSAPALGSTAIFGGNVPTWSVSALMSTLLEKDEGISRRAVVPTNSLDEAIQTGKFSAEQVAKVQAVFNVITSPEVSEEELQPVIEGAAKKLGVTAERVREVLSFAVSNRSPSCARECASDGVAVAAACALAGHDCSNPNKLNMCMLKMNNGDYFYTKTKCNTENCCLA